MDSGIEDIDTAMSIEENAAQLPANGRPTKLYANPKHPGPKAMQIYKDAMGNIDRRIDEEMGSIIEKRRQEDEEREIERRKEDEELRDRITKEETLQYGQAMMRYNEVCEGAEVEGELQSHEVKLERPKSISIDDVKVWESLVREDDVIYVLRCYSCIDARRPFKSKVMSVKHLTRVWRNHNREMHREKHGEMLDKDLVKTFGVRVTGVCTDMWKEFEGKSIAYNIVPCTSQRHKPADLESLIDSSDSSRDESNGWTHSGGDGQKIAVEKDDGETTSQTAADIAKDREVAIKMQKQFNTRSTRGMLETGISSNRPRRSRATPQSYEVPSEDDIGPDDVQPSPGLIPSDREQPKGVPLNKTSRLQEERKQDQSTIAEPDEDEDGDYESIDEEEESLFLPQRHPYTPNNHNPKDLARVESPGSDLEQPTMQTAKQTLPSGEGRATASFKLTGTNPHQHRSGRPPIGDVSTERQDQIAATTKKHTEAYSKSKVKTSAPSHTTRKRSQDLSFASGSRPKKNKSHTTSSAPQNPRLPQGKNRLGSPILQTRPETTRARLARMDTEQQRREIETESRLHAMLFRNPPKL